MRTGHTAGQHLFHAVGYLALLLALAVTILFVIHPWAWYFTGGLPTHWDPPTDAAHICWNAHNILHGSVLRPVYNANHFYPHAYTMAFSEPMWPPSFFAAIIYGLTGNPVLTWNATMLFFWALSGVIMYLLLRELPVSRSVAVLGAALCCLIPYRLGYYVELNMVLCFVIPLAYLFLIRWLRRLGRLDAVLFAVALWIAATTCLYYTAIMLVPMPFVVIAFLAGNPAMLRSRRFHATGILATFLAMLLCAATLYPYVLLRSIGKYERSVSQQARSSVQPLSYLRPSKNSLIHRFAPKADLGETTVFPGIALSALACLYWVRRRIVFRRWRGVSPRGQRRQVLAYIRAALWFLFTGLVVYGAYHTHASSFIAVKHLIVPAVNLVFWISLVLLFMPVERDATGPAPVLAGLGVGAVACFILSFGPTVMVGHMHDIEVVGHNVTERLHDAVPIFSMVRVMTRFSIMVLFFMITAGCVALDGVLHKVPRRLRWLWVLPLILLVIETYSRPYEFADQHKRFDSPVQRYLRELPDKVSLAQIPYGLRDFDGPAMLATVGKWHYLVNGWCGFEPRQHYTLKAHLSSDQAKAADWLREIWPEPYLLVDREGVRHWSALKQTTFTEGDLKPYWDRVMSDDRFTLFRLRPLDATPAHLVRRLRSDVLLRHPVLSLRAHAVELPDGATARLCVTVNGREVSEIELTAEPVRYDVTIPSRVVGNMWGEEVILTLKYVFADRTVTVNEEGCWVLDGLTFLTKKAAATP
ncbi:MAG: hypothetical protein JW889_07985 [Verrucomicrobia bacterium]|nr:hypothetical protein [Verrucomicrobiota bacterium]